MRTAEENAALASALASIRAVSLVVVEYGELAGQRAAAPALGQYARTIAADHRALITALDSVASLRGASLSETRETQELANTVRMAHSGLEGLNGSAFDLPFVRAEVESHRLLLDRIDQQLIPAVSDPETSGLLIDIRAMADAHLTRARQLLAERLGQTVEPAPPRPERRPPPAPRAEPPPDTIPQG
jgi:putative membrane protein